MCAGAAAVHLARTVCRRAERHVIGLAHAPGGQVPQPLLIYLNRLSDALFILARAANYRSDVPDIPWSGLWNRGRLLRVSGWATLNLDVEGIGEP